MLRLRFVLSATTFSSYNPDIAKNRVMPQTRVAGQSRALARPNLEGLYI